MEALEQRFSGTLVSDAALEEIRSAAGPIQDEMRQLIEVETPRRAAIEQRLKQLGDKPAAGLRRKQRK